MKENRLHVVFAPYEKHLITRPEYLKVLKKFRAMGAPYKDGLDELVPWILNETDLHLTQNNLSDRVVEFEEGLYRFIENKKPDLFGQIRDKKALDSEIEAILKALIEEFKAGFGN